MGKDALHHGMDGAVLRAMTFIHQYEDIGVGVSDLFFGDRFKFVDDRGDKVSFVFAD